ncbi:histidine phosphatase family protein [Sabulilitoribacter arenilitoris]|uniref:Histidine phosphatase family protein n=1 Tax=Wocania arenilitoris TaxID=2044858 RepID=A0AAE3ERL5_9FLAO|nr:histidine phosphatase family protein [Wocania arenilitoris]MCF7569119.1 histidine phosphatase family protein [Wocania arenilitoris]
MKKLILIRHAKSSWKHNVIDFERPLNNKGVKDAENVSNYLKSKGLIIDMVISSDAIRTKITANSFISNLNIDEKLVNFNHNLYDFSGYNLVKTIKEVDISINNLMVFGHNHAITNFVNTYGDKYIENVPTCGVTIIHFDIDNWANLSNGKTIFTLFPKDLK